ncbi:MAG: hypothetical protein IPK79_07565 [Vampirovibrionales bacterium]|nr:hypothetical protein [Vampirovibrionales bacterium]
MMLSFPVSHRPVSRFGAAETPPPSKTEKQQRANTELADVIDRAQREASGNWQHALAALIAQARRDVEAAHAAYPVDKGQ